MASSGQVSIPVITAIHLPYRATKIKHQMLLPDQCSAVTHPHSMPADVKVKQENSGTTAANNVSKNKPALPAKPESIGEMFSKRQPNLPSPSRGHNRSPSDGSCVKFRTARNKFECNHSKSELDLKCAGNETPIRRPLSIAERTKLFEGSGNVDSVTKSISPMPAPRPLSQGFDSPPAVQESKRSNVHLNSTSKSEILVAPCSVAKQAQSIAQMAKLFENTVMVESKNDKLKIESPERVQENPSISPSKFSTNIPASTSDLSDGATILNESVKKTDNSNKVIAFDVEEQTNVNNYKLDVPKGPPPPKPPRTYAHDIYLWVKAKSQNKQPLTVVPETPENTSALYQSVIPRSQRQPKKTLDEVDEVEKNKLQAMLEEFYTYNSKENLKSTTNDNLVNKVDLNVSSNPVLKPPRKSLPASSQGKPKLPPRPSSPVKQVLHTKPTPPRPPPPKPNYKSPFILNRKPLNDSVSLSNQKIPWPFDCISSSPQEKHIYDSVPEVNSRFFVALKQCNSPVSPSSSLKRSFSEEHIYAEPDCKRIYGSPSEEKKNIPQEKEVELRTGVTPYMSSPVRIRPRSRSLHDTLRSTSTSPPRDRQGSATPRQEPVRVVRHRGLTHVGIRNCYGLPLRIVGMHPA